MDAEQGDGLADLGDRLTASEEKRERLYGWLLEAREQVARLKDERDRFEKMASDAGELNAALADEIRMLRRELRKARMLRDVLVDVPELWTPAADSRPPTVNMSSRAPRRV